MTRKQQVLLARLQKLLEAQTPREWADTFNRVDERITALEIMKFSRALKRAIAVEEKNWQKKIDRSINDLPKAQRVRTTPSRGSARKSNESRMRKESPESGGVGDWENFLSALRRNYVVEDARPAPQIPEDREYSRWLKIIGRDLPSESPTVPQKSSPFRSRKR